MEDNMASSSTSLFLSSQSSPSQSPAMKHQNPPPSVTRQWRPKAQQNLRNQWSKLASFRKQWSSSSFSARSEATDLVNSYLSQRYMKGMELGVLSDMPDIKKKACWKMFKRQELYRRKLLSSYRNMVSAVVGLHNSSRSMRIFLKGTSSLLIQFSSIQEDKNDSGDGGGIPVYTFLSISSIEELARELVHMFTLELSLKRLLVVELLSLSSEEFQIDPVSWSDELYPGEFENLSICDLYSEEFCAPIYPKMKGSDLEIPAETARYQLDQEVLMVYLTTWLAEVYIDTYRVEEILAMVGEEIKHSLS